MVGAEGHATDHIFSYVVVTVTILRIAMRAWSPEER